MKSEGGITSSASLVRVLNGQTRRRPPIWFMRQAGRYLPEYRQTRALAGGFLELCLDPQLATEVTLQPVRRFGLDAAIIFSDILIVPYALGVKTWFEEGEGPRLEPIDSRQGYELLRPELDERIVAPVYEAIERVRASLERDVALIGFCGAPWTVATYLIAGRGTPDQGPAKRLMTQDERLFGNIIDKLSNAAAAHLIGQLKAGAEVVQIFDTWAGILDGAAFERWCVAPTAKIVAAVRAARPDAKVIVFPRGAGLDGMAQLVEATGADCVSVAANVDRKAVRERLGGGCALQGNLGPETLLAGGAALDRAIDQILADFRGVRHIFNLGHGILKETPVEHVERMIARVRSAGV